MKRHLFILAIITCLALTAEEPICISGVYPHLTMRNDEGECGTGAVVPWQGSLWAITYAPHCPNGSSDKLYQITEDLAQQIFAGSVGGTPANRMIHKESNQALIGPYLIDKDKNIRVLPPSKIYGRLTGNARHLTNPTEKVYYATMEEGLYEVDINTLEVTCLIKDNHGAAPKAGIPSELPGYHGKGLYSSQGRLVYSNNGEHGKAARTDPTTTSGALAQWFGKNEDWQLVRRNQFTEVTGPGGIHGNKKPATDPLWAMGWDARSVILALLQNQKWHYYRLPKGSHSYDGAHGWNTEWPRIREIGETDFLATMHGTFWKFPATFSLENSSGITPRSNYLKVIGDFCRWNNKVVFGCDDSAKSEFLNTRPFKAKHAAAKQSNSNLWFVDPEEIDHFGPAIGRGSVWLREDIKTGQISDPYLFSGYDHRQLYLVAKGGGSFTLEVDKAGNNTWETLREIIVPPSGSTYIIFDNEEQGNWVRLKSNQTSTEVTAHFQYRQTDSRPNDNAPIFAGICPIGETAPGGLMQSLAYDQMGFASTNKESGLNVYYEVNQKLDLTLTENIEQWFKLVKDVAPPDSTFDVDEASVILTEGGKRYRLPRNEDYITKIPEPDPQKTLSYYLDKSATKGAKVTVSATHGDYRAEYAVDGVIHDDEKRWIHPQKKTTVPDPFGNKKAYTVSTSGWIEIDLGKETELREIWIVTGWKGEKTYTAKHFDILFKQEEKWVKECEVVDNEAIELRYQFPAPIKTQFIRINSRESSFFRIYEVAAFSEALDIEEKPTSAPTPRVCREVATERDLLNLHGTFYELPARNAQGLAKVRPVATHDLNIHDFCSHNGLLFFSGIQPGVESDRIFRSDDGKAAMWAGVVDDLWKLGKPRGKGGPWFNHKVKANQPSDPYLMTGYDKKKITLKSTSAAKITIEVDIDGTDLWIPWQTFSVSPEKPVIHTFPDGFSAYWVRAICDSDTTATAQLVYE